MNGHDRVMGPGSESPEAAATEIGWLREKARRAMQAGSLPNRAPDRTWGGRGRGNPCAVCHVPISSVEPELELEFAGDDLRGADGWHLHVPCRSAWMAELDLDLARTPDLSDAPGRGAALLQQDTDDGTERYDP